MKVTFSLLELVYEQLNAEMPTEKIRKLGHPQFCVRINSSRNYHQNGKTTKNASNMSTFFSLKSLKMSMETRILSTFLPFAVSESVSGRLPGKSWHKCWVGHKTWIVVVEKYLLTSNTAHFFSKLSTLDCNSAFFFFNSLSLSFFARGCIVQIKAN